MDVFYYWKNYEADLKAGRIGHFKSTGEKLTEFSSGFPDFLWVFKTPRGRKGEVQLLAKLRWTDRATVALKPEPGHVYIHYDPVDRHSVAFCDSGTAAGIEATSRWVSSHFPRMLAANFQGTTGQEAIRGAALNELQRLASRFATQAFLPTAVATRDIQDADQQ
jgi:hypothetical protein